MTRCSGCEQATYCCRECQFDHWPWHARRCDKVAAVKAEFESKQRPSCRHGGAPLLVGHPFTEFFDAFTDEFRGLEEIDQWSLFRRYISCS